MTVFLGARVIAEIINEVGLSRFWRRLADFLREDFERWERFDKTSRLASHSAKGVIELMPASDGEFYAFKFVNGHPGNAAFGLQTVVAFGALAEVATGYPVLLADMTLATALRTAATSALAARYLARPESRTMALIGLGAQSEFQASAFAALLGLDRLRIFDIDPDATRKFEKNMAGARVSITRCASVAEAVAGADIVTTITADKKAAAILTEATTPAGAHINAVGGDCPGKTELSRELVQRSRIFVEYEPQTRLEGEIQQLAADHPVTELWEVIVGRKPGRTTPAEITLFDSVGFAIEDFSILRLLRVLAAERGAGEDIDLLASPRDPKDLFALLTPALATEKLQCA